MMNCPKCSKNRLKLREVLFCSYDDPIYCHNCDEYFFIHRVLSKIYRIVVFYSGLFVLVLLVAFSSSTLMGIISIIVMGALVLLIAAFEAWLLDLKEHDQPGKYVSKSVMLRNKIGNEHGKT